MILLLLVGVFGYLNKEPEPEPSYAEIKALFEQEKVKSFTISDTTLKMELREEVDGKTTVTKDLYDFDLFYDDLNELVEKQKAEGILEDYDYGADHSPNYLTTFLPYVIAILGMFAIWYFISVRSVGGGGDRMAKFGMANFKSGRDSSRPTTFSDVAGAQEEKEELAELENYGVDGLRHVARSYVSMIKPGMRITPEEAHTVQMARLRAQLNSDELEVRRMKRALALIEDDPYYEIIKQYYYRCKPDSAISYRMNCDTATVGRNRRRLVKKLALRLYGADVLE